MNKDLRGRKSVGIGAVMVYELDTKILGDGLELMIIDVRQKLPRKLNGAERRITEPAILKNSSELVV